MASRIPVPVVLAQTSATSSSRSILTTVLPSLRKSVLNRSHQISIERFQFLQNLQRGCCAFCGVPFVDKKIVIDHSHTCPSPLIHKIRSCGDGGCLNCIRGLLCYTCNTFLGRVEKLIAVGWVQPLAKLAEYLSRRPLKDRTIVEGSSLKTVRA